MRNKCKEAVTTTEEQTPLRLVIRVSSFVIVSRLRDFVLRISLSSESANAHAVFFPLPGVLDGESGPGLNFEAGLGDGDSSAFADAVGAVLDFRQGVVDFAEQRAVFFHQGEGEFLLVIVGAHVSHVDWQG